MSIIELAETQEMEPVPGCRVRFVHSAHMTLAYWNIEAGAGVPEHSHPHEQIVNVLEGEFDLVMDGKPYALSSGRVLVIPSGVPHSGRAATDCRILDAFYPVREDYR